MPDQNATVGTPAIVVMSIGLFGAILACGYAAIAFWPAPCTNGQCPNNATQFIGWAVTVNRAENLLLLVVVSGAIGALIHVASSFADYVGNRQLIWSWVWWLMLRIPIGVALALVFYLLIRGGLIIPNGSTEPEINPYGTAGLAALVGMFAKQATDKLAEIFDTLFRSDKESTRADPLARSGGTDAPKAALGGATAELVGLPVAVKDKN